MKSALAFAALLAFASTATLAGGPGDRPGQDGKPSNNLGEVTADQITNNDFDQGGHASEPGTGEPRTGLANVVEQGNLEATTDHLIGILYP